jgi:membrane associated rhomboid family serine protease
MIFPLLRGFLSIRKAPITWLIFFLNGAVMLWGWGASWTANDKLDELMSEEFFLETQGHIYENYLKENELRSPEIAREIASAGSIDHHHYRLLGHFAFRDQDFLDDAPQLNLYNDEVAVKHWKKQLRMIRDLQETHPSYILGVSTDSSNVSLWLTYIFSHSSGIHFAGNMLFLLLFGAALEQIIGGLALFVVFLGTGIFAAGFFLWLSGPTTAPLIGASGAISGIMSMLCVLCWKKPIRFLYWLMIPTRNAMGFIYLPAWTVFALWFLGDMAGYLGNLDIMGGVAHAAHLGGDLSGAIVGIAIVGLWSWRGALPDIPAPQAETWKLYPFFTFYQFRRLR